MKLAISHAWDISASEAIALQQQLRERVISRDEFGPLRLVAGVDVGMTSTGAKASVVVHKISLSSAVRLILTLTKIGQRLPEPTRLAHLLSTGSLALNSKADSSRESFGNLRLFS